MAIDEDDDGKMSFQAGSIPEPPRDILRLCPGMFNTVVSAGKRRDSLDEVIDDDEIRLAHFSVKQYLQSDDKFQHPYFHIGKTSTNAYQARACLAYVDLITQGNVLEYPLATYSAQYWPTHSRMALGDKETSRASESLQEIGSLERLEEEIDKFLLSEHSRQTWITLYDPDQQKPRYDATAADVVSPIYYASLCGLWHHVRRCLARSKADVEARGGLFERPLRAACRHGFISTARLLLENGAVFPDDSSEDRREDIDVLSDAAKSGNMELVKFLLDKEREEQQDGRITDLVSHIEPMKAVGGDLEMIKLLATYRNTGPPRIDMEVWKSVLKDLPTVPAGRLHIGRGEGHR